MGWQPMVGDDLQVFGVRLNEVTRASGCVS
jgi:hypothetical protein